MESIQDYTDIPRDQVDWKLYIKKTSRFNQVLAGHMFVKEKIGPLGVGIEDKFYT